MRLFIALILALAACQKPNTNQVEPERLHVAPTTIDFGQVYVGASSHQRVTLENPSRVARTVTLTFPQPFVADTTGEVTLPGGGGLDVTLSYTPTQAEHLDASAELDGTTVTLRAEGLAPLMCMAPDACATVDFDAAQGVCRVARKPSGAACASSCVAHGQCVDDVCRGAFEGCDDGDACTVDACSEAAGCIHTEAACPAATDPCQVPACDRATGCLLAPAPDGTRCGAEDCAANTSRVCIDGACRTRQRPTGAGLCFEVVAGQPERQFVFTGLAQETFVAGSLFAAVTDRFGTTTIIDGRRVRRFTAAGLATLADAQRPYSGLSPSPAHMSVDGFGVVTFADGTFSGTLSTVQPSGHVAVRPGPQVFSDFEVSSDGTLFTFDSAGVFVLEPDGGRTQVSSRSVTRLHAPARRPNEVLAVNTLDDAGSLLFAVDATGHERIVAEPFFSVGPAASFGVFHRLNADGVQVERTFEGDGGRGLDLISLTGARTRLSQGSYDAVWFGNDDTVRAVRGNELVVVSATGVTPFAGHPSAAAEAPQGLAAFYSPPFLSEAPYAPRIAATAEGVFIANSFGTAPYNSILFTADAGLRHLGSEPMTLTKSADGGLAYFADGGLWRPNPNGGATWLQALQVRTPLTEGLLTIDLADGGTRNGYGLGALQEDDGSWTVAVSDGVWSFNPAGQLLGETHLRSSFLAVDGPFDTAAGGGFTRPIPMGARSYLHGERASVRSLSPSGVTTLAGNALVDGGFVDGLGAAARFWNIKDLAWAQNGNLYVADCDNLALREVTRAGQVSTVARFDDCPLSVDVAPNGDVYVLIPHALLRSHP